MPTRPSSRDQFADQRTPVADARGGQVVGPLYGRLFTALLLQSVVLIIEPSLWVQQPLNVAFSIWMAMTIRGITGRHADLWIAAGLGVMPAVVEMIFPFGTAGIVIDAVKNVLWMGFPTFLGIRLFPSLFSARSVSHHELLGAMGLYILMGMAFANLHETIFLFDPDAIRFDFLAEGMAPNYGHFLYFSFVTLATLGFGDVAPVHPLGQLAVVIEAVMGLMFMAIMVARLVSLHAASEPSAPDG